MSRAMTGAQMVLRALADQGVEHIFGYPGGAVLPIYDALFKQNGIKHILVRHEQGAVHAAEGYARSTGKAGVVLVTSGPGATNAVTGLTDALMDSIPLVVHHRPGADASDRQRRLPGMRHGRHHPALHQAQLAGEGRERSARVLHEAFYIARTGRPGPVVVDIPKDVQFAKGAYTGPSQRRSTRPTARSSRATMRADRAGGRDDGERPSGRSSTPAAASSIPGPAASELLRELVRMTGFPITSTLMGLGAFPASRPAMARHARHARHLRSQHRHARLRPDDLHRRALRRPRHRPARRLLARLEEDPRRYRPLARSTRTSGSTCPSSATAPMCCSR